METGLKFSYRIYHDMQVENKPDDPAADPQGRLVTEKAICIGVDDAEQEFSITVKNGSNSDKYTLDPVILFDFMQQFGHVVQTRIRMHAPQAALPKG